MGYSWKCDKLTIVVRNQPLIMSKSVATFNFSFTLWEFVKTWEELYNIVDQLLGNF